MFDVESSRWEAADALKAKVSTLLSKLPSPLKLIMT